TSWPMTALRAQRSASPLHTTTRSAAMTTRAASTARRSQSFSTVFLESFIGVRPNASCPLGLRLELDFQPRACFVQPTRGALADLALDQELTDLVLHVLKRRHGSSRGGELRGELLAVVFLNGLGIHLYRRAKLIVQIVH